MRETTNNRGCPYSSFRISDIYTHTIQLRGGIHITSSIIIDNVGTDAWKVREESISVIRHCI